MRKPTVVEAVQSLTTQGFGWDGGEDCIVWPETNTGDAPTKEEIDAKLVELIAEYDAQEYARNRASAYDSIGNQLDLLFHDMTAGKGTKTGEWYKAVAKVKADNPKG